MSCAFCVFASRDALMIAGHHNPELLAEYVAVEREIGWSFKRNSPNGPTNSDAGSSLDIGNSAIKTRMAC